MCLTQAMLLYVGSMYSVIKEVFYMGDPQSWHAVNSLSDCSSDLSLGEKQANTDVFFSLFVFYW